MRTARLIALALIAIGCATASQTQRPSVTLFHPTQAPATVRLSPRVATPKLLPTRAPTPEPTPGAHLSLSDFRYSATGCWSTDWYDADGHNTPGLEAKFSVKIKNDRNVDSQNVWITLTTTDATDSYPSPAKRSWKKPIAASQNAKELYLVAPVVPGKKTIKLSWSVIFHTPFDAHYIIDFATGEWHQGMASIPELDSFTINELWTANAIC